MAMVVERVNAVDDVLVHDKYGTIRFCIYGSQTKRAQIDVYVTSEFPIGIVKDNVIYDQHREPVCIVEPRDVNQCCGPPSFNIMSYDKQLVGRINPEHGEIFFQYDYDLQSTIKALIVSKCVQLAFSQYAMASDYISLPLAAVPYKTKSQGKATTQQPGLTPPPGEPDNRPSSVKKAVRAEHDMKIPVTYRKLSILDTITEITMRMVGRDNEIEYYELLDPTERIFLTFELNRILQEIVIKNRYGEKVFRLHGSTNAWEPLELTLVNGTPAGRVDGNKMYDQTNRLMLEGRPYTNQCCGPLSYVIYQNVHNNVGYISPEGKKVRIGVDTTLDSISKGLIIARAFNLAVTTYNLNKEPLPLVKYIYEDGSESLYYRKLRSGTTESPERHGTSHSQLAVLKPLTEVRLRAAGYSTKAVHYYELINSADDKIKLTFECREKEGLVEAKEKHGISQYAASGLWGMQSDLVINLSKTKPLGIVKNGIFLDLDGNKIMYAQQRSTPQIKINGKLFAFKIYSMGNEAIGSIYPEISTVLIQVRQDLDVAKKALIFVFALKLAYNVYQLNKLPIPLVEYGYLPVPAPVKPVPAILPLSATGKEKTAVTQPPTVPAPTSQFSTMPAPTTTTPSRLSRMPWPGMTGLTILKHVSTIKLLPIGFSRNNVRYYKLIDGEKDRSFLTCECASPADDMMLNDKYGDPRFFVRGAWDESEPLTVYITYDSKLGTVVNDAIFDQNANPLFYINQTTSMFRNTVIKIVKPSAPKKVMATVSMVDNQVVTTLDLALSVQAKALVLAYGLRLAFTSYGIGKVKLPRVRYEYVSKNRKKKHDRMITNAATAGGSVRPKQERLMAPVSGRPDTPAVVPEPTTAADTVTAPPLTNTLINTAPPATNTAVNTARPPPTTIITGPPPTTTVTPATINAATNTGHQPTKEVNKEAAKSQTITEAQHKEPTPSVPVQDDVLPAKLPMNETNEVVLPKPEQKPEQVIPEKQTAPKEAPAPPTKTITEADHVPAMKQPQAGDSVMSGNKPAVSADVSEAPQIKSPPRTAVGSTTRNNMGDSALMGVRAIQSHQKPDLMDDTSVMSNQIPRRQEKASKAKQ